ncbi:MAG: hypothetical protein KAU17_04575 [Spirochaetales bacterium]|nr:hypothetical protein [Spirochaetales bacterium]
MMVNRIYHFGGFFLSGNRLPDSLNYNLWQIFVEHENLKEVYELKVRLLLGKAASEQYRQKGHKKEIVEQSPKGVY